ncbi:hypothetical protein [Streptococcus suis]|uniref:hypothetical protein n=1 Tax=Streptococcus suis TaxID=1307 RepID=UPI00211887DC|nr:hypothetical protein [Streptococcus suis]MCQ8263421.1 hypothetical protein [Streptococcus suis]
MISSKISYTRLIKVARRQIQKIKMKKKVFDMKTKTKNIYSVIIAIALCLVFKLFANLSEDNIKDFFNILAVSIPGSMITLTILKNKEKKDKKMKIEKYKKLFDNEMEEIYGGCSLGVLTRTVVKGGGNPTKIAVNAGIYVLTCWW